MMAIQQPDHLYLLLIVPVFVLLSVRSYSRRKKWLHRFAWRELRRTPFMVSGALTGLIMVLLILSISGACVQYRKSVFTRTGVEIAVGIDISKSMLAEDVAFPEAGRSLFHLYNRLNRARLFALSLVAGLRGERLGAFLFADSGIEIIPFTQDYGYCNYIFRHINGDEITQPGSDLATAIHAGIAMLAASRRSGLKALVLLSDGEDINDDPGAIESAARLAAQQRIRIYTVGIGGTSPALIPIRNAAGTVIRNYLLDENDTFVTTRLSARTLQRIAELSGGVYLEAGDPDTPRTLTNVILKRARHIDETRRIEIARFDLSGLFIIGALTVLLVQIAVRLLFRNLYQETI